MLTSRALALWQRKFYLIAVIARAVRANDLAAAAVARCVARRIEARRQLHARLARAEAKKRALDAERQKKISAHHERIARAAAHRRGLQTMSLLVTDHEAKETMEIKRPPPILVPYDPAWSDENISPYTPEILYTPRHDSSSPELSSDDDPSPPPVTLHPVSPAPLPRGGGRPGAIAPAEQEQDLTMTLPAAWTRRLSRAATPMRVRQPLATLALGGLMPRELYDC